MTIRACATCPPYTIVLTWLSDSTVWRLDRLTGASQEVGSADTLSEFNVSLAEHGIQAIGLRRRRKYEEQPEQFELVF
jgi:hypothetical protein